MSIGSFCLIKNEREWIAQHVLCVLPWLDEMVFFDGDSTDGTTEILWRIRRDHPSGSKIKIFSGCDPKDLKDDYVRLSNEAMRSLSTDWAMFLHPDMIVENPEQFAVLKDSPGIAMSCDIRSFAGEPGGDLLELSGRSEHWKNIYRLRNPEMGAHYFGHYGAWNEDVYFHDITGNDHKLYNDHSRYPYEVIRSGLKIMHFSDVRPYSRRLGRMLTCLENQGWPNRMSREEVEVKAKTHPRVCLMSSPEMRFFPAEYPKDFIEIRERYRGLWK